MNAPLRQRMSDWEYDLLRGEAVRAYARDEAATVADIARGAGVSDRTVYRWARETPTPEWRARFAPKSAGVRAEALRLYSEEPRLTVADICRRLGVGNATLYRWVKEAGASPHPRRIPGWARRRS